MRKPHHNQRKDFSGELSKCFTQFCDFQVVHGDIKLDNILISKDLKNVAICDYGTADWNTECAPPPSFSFLISILELSDTLVFEP